MFSSVLSAVILGMDVCPVQVEADVSDGLPAFTMVGYASSQVKEAQDRVRTSLKNINISLPPKRITINLSPANIRKEGSGFDLPVAAAILCASRKIPEESLHQVMITGELSLNGNVSRVPGVLPMVLRARELGCRACIIPRENMEEGALVKDMKIIGVGNLADFVKYCRNPKTYQYTCIGGENNNNYKKAKETIDFSDIHGQGIMKRAAEIAVSGFHNLLLIGPPGSGKTMIARRIPTILPELTFEESLEITRIYSIAGLLSEETPILTERPFRAPHHTSSPQSLAGGGKNPRPGEVTLAHRSVLFLDEIPEFSRKSLEILRQPLEDRCIQLSRVQGTYTFPANFLLVAAMNPCPCGFYPDMNRCTCSIGSIQHYLQKLSRPLLDRIDLCIEVPEITYEQIKMNQKKQFSEETSAEIRKRVQKVHEIQKERYQNTPYHYNAELPSSLVEQYCIPTQEGEAVLEKAYETYHLSGRGYHRILKTARTIADMSESSQIQPDHIREALGLRVPDKKYWQ